MVRMLCSLAAVVFLFAAVPSAQVASARTTAKTAQAATGLINLNAATQAELETLPGIGAKTAARIIDYRLKKGPFKKIEELMNVQGIGEKSFLKLKPQITVAPTPEGATAQQK